MCPICFTRNGDVMMEVDGGKLIVFNLKENTRRIISLYDHKDRGLNVVAYVESLIFPNHMVGMKTRGSDSK